MTDLGFFLDNDLGVSGNAGGKIGWQADCLIKRIGVQRLGAAKYCRHGLKGGADHVVVGILLGEAPA